MKEHGKCNSKVAAQSRNILLNKMYPSYWKEKKNLKSSVYLLITQNMLKLISLSSWFQMIFSKTIL